MQLSYDNLGLGNDANSDSSSESSESSPSPNTNLQNLNHTPTREYLTRSPWVTALYTSAGVVPVTPTNRGILNDVPTAPSHSRERRQSPRDRGDVRRRLEMDQVHVIPTIRNTALPCTSVANMFGVSEDINDDELQTNCYDIALAWENLRAHGEIIQRELGLVLSDGGNVYDPVSRKLGPIDHSIRRACQRVLLDFVTTCNSVFSNMIKTFRMDKTLIGINFAHSAVQLCNQAEAAEEYLRDHNCPPLGFLSLFKPPDDSDPTANSVIWLNPTRITGFMLREKCLVGLRISLEHWQAVTREALFSNVGPFPHHVSDDAVCIICMEDFRKEGFMHGGVISRRCDNPVFGVSGKSCEGHECKCNSSKDTEFQNALIHDTCLSRCLYESRSETFAGGYSHCPSCKAQYCLLDLCKIRFVQEPCLKQQQQQHVESSSSRHRKKHKRTSQTSSMKSK